MQFRKQLTKDPHFYWCTLLVLFTGFRHEEGAQLLRNQIQITDAGINYIRIREAKTPSGIREVPIPQAFMDHGFWDFIKARAPQEPVFRYSEGNAVGKKFSRVMTSVGAKRHKLVFHSLRKFVNNQLLRDKVGLEVRCQFIGHEINNVNVESYAEEFNVDEIHLIVHPTIERIMKLTPVLAP